MFEKEAKEYVPNINWHAYSSKEIREEMIVCYQKGAEFGYNKANGRFTKAKEVIKNLIDSLMAIDGEQIRELSVVKEAEQLLNSDDA